MLEINKKNPPVAFLDNSFCENELDVEMQWEDFKNSLEEEFYRRSGVEVNVVGRNMGWQNLTGQKTFYLFDPLDIFYKIKPDTDQLTFYLYKKNENEYLAKISHHDAMNETYEIKIN